MNDCCLCHCYIGAAFRAIAREDLLTFEIPMIRYCRDDFLSQVSDGHRDGPRRVLERPAAHLTQLVVALTRPLFARNVW